MIAMLTGRVHERGPDGCVIDVGGVGYELAMSTNSLAALPAEGDTTTVLAHLHVRDDGILLFGFGSAEEKELFEMLISVSGVGPRVALAALSASAPGSLKEAIAREDETLIASAPGIGKKTAQRIIVELKDRLDLPDLREVPAGATDAFIEAQEALAGMGFSRAEAVSAVAGFEGDPDTRAEDLVKYALKRLGGV